MGGDEIRQAVEGVRAYLVEHPEKGRSSDRAATAVVDAGLRCRVEGPDGAAVVTDMPARLGGGASAPTPGWLARAALASCEATMIALRAAEEGIALERIEVTVESDSDIRGLVGADETVAAGPFEYRTHVRIAAGGLEPERLAQLVEWAEGHSPVGDALRRAVPVRAQIDSVTAEPLST